jgi:hypothetical protein
MWQVGDFCNGDKDYYEFLSHGYSNKEPSHVLATSWRGLYLGLNFPPSDDHPEAWEVKAY